MRRVIMSLVVAASLIASAAPSHAGLTWNAWKKAYAQENRFTFRDPPPREGMALVVWVEEREEARQRWLDRAWRANQRAVARCGEAYIADLTTCQPKPVLRTSYPAQGAYVGGSVNWDAIAACESGGNWATNTGNGYWGGLQFHPGTWFGNGGGPFDGHGPFPYSRGQQIPVAERVLASQGIGAWPYCGRFA